MLRELFGNMFYGETKIAFAQFEYGSKHTEPWRCTNPGKGL